MQFQKIIWMMNGPLYCHPERSAGSVAIGVEMLRGVYPECNEWPQGDNRGQQHCTPLVMLSVPLVMLSVPLVMLSAAKHLCPPRP